MTAPFWRDLIKQDALEAQYEVLRKEQVVNVYSDKEVALHLARFAEAKIFVAAERRITELEAHIAKLLQLLKEPA